MGESPEVVFDPSPPLFLPTAPPCLSLPPLPSSILPSLLLPPLHPLPPLHSPSSLPTPAILRSLPPAYIPLLDLSFHYLPSVSILHPLSICPHAYVVDPSSTLSYRPFQPSCPLFFPLPPLVLSPSPLLFPFLLAPARPPHFPHPLTSYIHSPTIRPFLPGFSYSPRWACWFPLSPDLPLPS